MPIPVLSLMPTKSGQVQVALKIPDTDLPVPEGANWFHLTNSNADVQLLVGYIDPRVTHAVVESVIAGKAAHKATIAPEVTHRLLLSITGFLYLRAQVEEMFVRLREKGTVTTELDVLASPDSYK